MKCLNLNCGVDVGEILCLCDLCYDYLPLAWQKIYHFVNNKDILWFFNLLKPKDEAYKIFYNELMEDSSVDLWRISELKSLVNDSIQNCKNKIELYETKELEKVRNLFIGELEC